MKRYPFCITFTATAYATNDTTIIRHVYKPDCAVYVPLFHDRKLGPVAMKSAAVFGLVLFQVNGDNVQKAEGKYVKMYHLTP